MIQPMVYTRDHIIDAAYELVREHGWAGLSTRTLAKRIGCSTMPIYSQVRSVAELEGELLKRANDALQTYQKKPFTDNPLLNLAIGYVVFARDERQLFRFLFLDKANEVASGQFSGLREAFARNTKTAEAQLDALAPIPIDSQESLIQHTWIYTHGLAMMVNAGVLGDCPDTVIKDYLNHAGGAFYHMATITDKGGREDA
jgi:AcrR family transcriptional regulator